MGGDITIIYKLPIVVWYSTVFYTSGPLRTARTAVRATGRSGHFGRLHLATVLYIVTVHTRRMGHNGLHAGGMYWRGYNISTKAVGVDLPVLRNRRVAPGLRFVLMRRSRGNTTTRGSPRPRPRGETFTPCKNTAEGRRFICWCY
jgi:hypothetical protein